jgi:hypothetical protein
MRNDKNDYGLLFVVLPTSILLVHNYYLWSHTLPRIDVVWGFIYIYIYIYIYILLLWPIQCFLENDFMKSSNFK